MASPETIAAGATGNVGPLSVDTLFFLAEGRDLLLSTDAGTTYIPLNSGFRHLVVSSGLTVHWSNTSGAPVELRYMAI